MDRTDAELVERARQGDSAAFGGLVRRYLGNITLLARQKMRDRAAAEDVAQEAFIRAFKSLDSLQDPEKFGAWLYNIAFRICIDHLRKSSRRAAISYDTLVENGAQPSVEQAPGAALEQAESEDALRDALSELPDAYRLVLTLRYMKRMSYQEIADHLAEPQGTIANRLHRATRMLRERMTRGASRP